MKRSKHNDNSNLLCLSLDQADSLSHAICCSSMAVILFTDSPRSLGSLCHQHAGAVDRAEKHVNLDSVHRLCCSETRDELNMNMMECIAMLPSSIHLLFIWIVSYGSIFAAEAPVVSGSALSFCCGGIFEIIIDLECSGHNTHVHLLLSHRGQI